MRSWKINHQVLNLWSTNQYKKNQTIHHCTALWFPEGGRTTGQIQIDLSTNQSNPDQPTPTNPTDHWSVPGGSGLVEALVAVEGHSLMLCSAQSVTLVINVYN